tara:strand:- start:176 stop:376 length:201 start_codon:yes stop_codon:yes gene_type:complete
VGRETELPAKIMKTIPDAIDDMKLIIKKIIDKPLSWMEHIGSKMNVYAWNKRWGNKEKGYGYRDER